MSDIIALYLAPKQRMTRQYGFVIKTNFCKYQNRQCYSVHRYYVDNNTTDNGIYDLTLADAWTVYHDRIEDNAANYSVGTFEDIQSPLTCFKREE